MNTLSKPVFAYCETVTASPFSPHHIRQLTEVGLKLGGGADTPALCGRALNGGWDTQLIPADADVLAESAESPSLYSTTWKLCRTCALVYLAVTP